VILEGRPPRKTLGQLVFFFGFCIDRGLHGFGSIVLPSKECGQLWMTPSMLFGSLKVTKPKPRLRPVSAFFITTQSITSPNLEKYRSRVSWVVSQLSPPTNNLPSSWSSCLLCFLPRPLPPPPPFCWGWAAPGANAITSSIARSGKSRHSSTLFSCASPSPSFPPHILKAKTLTPQPLQSLQDRGRLETPLTPDSTV